MPRRQWKLHENSDEVTRHLSSFDPLEDSTIVHDNVDHHLESRGHPGLCVDNLLPDTEALVWIGIDLERLDGKYDGTVDMFVYSCQVQVFIFRSRGSYYIMTTACRCLSVSPHFYLHRVPKSTSLENIMDEFKTTESVIHSLETLQACKVLSLGGPEVVIPGKKRKRENIFTS